MVITGFTPLFTPETIHARVNELAASIDATYGDDPLIAICVLKGAFVFFSDLVRAIHNPNLTVDFVRLSSYGSRMSSTGSISFVKDVETSLRGRHVLVVEDVVDSGLTMRFFLDQLQARGPKSLRLAALVDKRERRTADVTVDFPGFRLDRGFIVGYGLDYDEQFRHLPGICCVEHTDN